MSVNPLLCKPAERRPFPAPELGPLMLGVAYRLPQTVPKYRLRLLEAIFSEAVCCHVSADNQTHREREGLKENLNPLKSKQTT